MAEETARGKIEKEKSGGDKKRIRVKNFVYNEISSYLKSFSRAEVNKFDRGGGAGGRRGTPQNGNVVSPIYDEGRKVTRRKIEPSAISRFVRQ